VEESYAVQDSAKKDAEEAAKKADTTSPDDVFGSEEWNKK